MTATTRHAALHSMPPHSGSGSTQGSSEAGSRSNRLPDFYGRYVFNDKLQRERLPKDVYEALRRVIETGSSPTPEIADVVAGAMKTWALEFGATHYTHWFQPMTGSTAEKHDSFLKPTSDGGAILEFSGKQLFQGEPDASSFPSGGLRATFEARGYTAWDPTSPAFLRLTPDGGTLTIPTAFCSWTGAALDKKTPLLRSCEAVSKSATRLLNLVGDEKVKRVSASAGLEQEYFLIDEQFFKLRPDLVACGRTLFGARPFKGQEFDDHYFGNISPRVLSFMQELERELWYLGVPVTTRHNEVAPSQFELAPIYQGISVAIDQNMLTMEIIKEIAERHGFAALLHEKPFANLNGSGKHLNWSLADNLGNNLLEPGQTPHENLKFILVLAAIVRGVDLHQDMLRASIASAGNDHRLGANEAPPAIISIFMGSQLEEVINAIVEGRAAKPASGDPLRLGVTALPDLPRDATDRNRTSPFAFTGNKFEFRAVGSSQSAAYPATLLNLAAAESLDYVSDQIEALGGPSTDNITAVVREIFTAHQRILFSGDNYTDDWRDEAARRGLLNRSATPEALGDWASNKNVELYERYRVFSSDEAQSRSNVLNETYANKVNVEAIATRDIAMTMILPAAMEHQRRVAASIAAVAAVMDSPDLDAQREVLTITTLAISRTKRAVDELLEAQTKLEASGLEGGHLAHAYAEQILPIMAKVRESADLLERLVDDELWPLPKYREMLFLN